MIKIRFLPVCVAAAFVLASHCPAAAAPMEFGGHWYDIVDGSYPWLTTKEISLIRSYRGLPGHLATINSAGERDFLNQNATRINANASGRKYWLGGDQLADGSWGWVSGESWGYTDWMAGSPGNTVSADNFLLTQIGASPSWSVGNGTLHGYIIEYEDMCPSDPAKLTPGVCGCGVPEDTTDSDGDGVPNCGDDCRDDGAKTSPGECGCGVPETGDSDGDGVADCNDACPEDGNKVVAGQCGCGNSETGDSDGDGTRDCNEQCPNDPLKTEPGTCGCGIADTDSDNDGTPDCNDQCPDDPLKTEPGTCGCGVVDTDTDSDDDGTADCLDQCPADPLKTDPGTCGCGVVDDSADNDNDGTANCADFCPDSPGKTAPGVCGCETADTDTDADGIPDCNDSCPSDVGKIVAGVCGCGVADTDSDNDGTPDCNDACPFDVDKIEPGGCGCGTPDSIDSDGDLVFDCVDNAPHVYNPRQGDFDKDGVGDYAEFGPNPTVPNYLYDGNNDGLPDWQQKKVASLYSAAGNQYVTLALNDGQVASFTQVKARSNPALASSPAGVDFLQGFFDFSISSLPANDDVVVTIFLANGQTPDTGYMYGPTSDNAQPHWYEFLYDGSTGAAIEAATNNIVTIHLRDGGRGDSDRTINGVITGVGAPGMIDSDNDGIGNLSDGCPTDAGKSAPGVCGCGTVDSVANIADDDGDLIENCNDGCPADSGKTEAGICGCGSPETADSDGDGTLDCIDSCPADSGKSAAGLCGCGVADVAPNTSDDDGDGILNCNDLCPGDVNKTEPGQCGCGSAETTDLDSDGVLDCNDACPHDSDKTEAGLCGCGVADTDSDSDGTPDCHDLCVNDSGKTLPGQCGCGVADTDSDSDGTADCNDGCPADIGKTAAGICGCGRPETGDRDGDGSADCNDMCPDDANKVVPELCGCGVADTNLDGDFLPDCMDYCPNDGNKTDPGYCGCDVSETGDSDGDGVHDCNETCIDDPLKTEPGACGCGVADTDSDGDGTADCNDTCPNDSTKGAPGACGCGIADTDTDNDGTADCNDPCFRDPNKVDPGPCGCGISDGDSDGDSNPNLDPELRADCTDNAPFVWNYDQRDSDGDGVGDWGEMGPDGYDPFYDGNGDGISDWMQDTAVSLYDGSGTQYVTVSIGVDETTGVPLPGYFTRVAPRGVSSQMMEQGTSFPNEVEFPLNLFDIQVTLDSPGQSTAVVIDMPTLPVERAPDVWFKFGSTLDNSAPHWYEFNDNGTTGAVLSPNRVILYLTDGLRGDSTGVDGKIVDPGGFAVRDFDGDGVKDGMDNCPAIANPLQEDADTDGKGDVCDVCPGGPDTDADGDGVADCNDNCPNDAAKIEPGICGCGAVEDLADADGDGVAGCADGCPADPAKTEAGVCGCGVDEDIADDDGDGTLNCFDSCPTDSGKTEPGFCGCGNADTDSDADGVVDCNDNCPSDPAKTEAGLCGCGRIEDLSGLDSDNDGMPNCSDDCPYDAAKTTPGLCGCGVVDSTVDSDGDLTPNCLDLCPEDDQKIEPGVCGCGEADTGDSDGDGLADCVDFCPNDPGKTEAGLCGCGRADVDTDGDLILDCNDNCPLTANADQTDSDGDGIGDLCDLSANSGAYIMEVHYDQGSAEQEFVELQAIGQSMNLAGWRLTDQESETFIFDKNQDARFPCDGLTLAVGERAVIWQGTGTSVCTGPVRQIYMGTSVYLQRSGDDLALIDAGNVCRDYVAFEAGSTVNPPPAGCSWDTTSGVLDNGGTRGVSVSRFEAPLSVTRSSADWAASGTLTTIGPVSAGLPNQLIVDTDGDGIADANDGCPADANKAAAGACGCGQADTDSDADGTADCIDACPADAAKIVIGTCGCGVIDTPGCGAADNCPNDPNKTEPGICGCGQADTDSDADGTADCIDACPADAAKSAIGTCGCGVLDTPGCAGTVDNCPNDPNKTEPGVCGCGVVETNDFDGDGVLDCVDPCWDDELKIEPGACGCGEDETGDTDGDGLADCVDAWPTDPTNGAGSVDSDGDGTPDTSDGCPSDAGKISAGQCGCGIADTDTDSDGVANCHDNCLNTSNPNQQDSNGNGVGDACEAAVPGSVYISEVHYDQGTGQQEFIELVATGGTPVDLSGWKVTDVDIQEAIFGAGTVLNPGERLVVWQGTGVTGWVGSTYNIYLGVSVFLSRNGDDVALYDATNACRDYVLLEGGDSLPIPTGCAWSGVGANNGGTTGVSVSRFDAPLNDTDSNADWEASGTVTAGPTSPGAVNGGGSGSGTDTDSDGFIDSLDGCPSDPNKSAVGQCGCGILDTDTDGDGVADCVDAWPTDPTNGAGSVDTDGDGTPDTSDGCPSDAVKIAAGQCGCGIADTDTDNDGVANCRDNCLNTSNPNQQDSNGNGVGDACEAAVPGSVYISEVHYDQGTGQQEFIELVATGGTPVDLSGWKVTDVDIQEAIFGAGTVLNPGERLVVWQGTGVTGWVGSTYNIYLGVSVFLSRNGEDVALFDAAGTCRDYVLIEGGDAVPIPAGCAWSGVGANNGGVIGVSVSRFDAPVNDTNSSADWEASGTTTAGPTTPGSVNGGGAGSGTLTDSDGDGTPDTSDGCPSDADKISAGQCGCGIADTDTDSDGVANCLDNCLIVSNPNQQDNNGNGVGDVCEASAPGSVLISEVHYDQRTSEQEFIELVVTGGTPVDLSGWKVTDVDIQEVIFGAGTVFNPGDRIVIWHGAGATGWVGSTYYIYMNVNVFLSRNGDDVALYDASNVCRDYVLIEGGDALPIPAGCAWSGVGADNGGTTGVSISRNNPVVDSNSASDWAAGAISPGL